MKLADLIIDLQYRGLRVNAPFERRPGGAGPSDAGMIWIEGTAVTVPVDAGFVADSPYTLEPSDAGFGILFRRYCLSKIFTSKICFRRNVIEDMSADDLL